MANLHMRTWSNVLPRAAHPAATPVADHPRKKARPGAGQTGQPHALAEGRAAAGAKVERPPDGARLSGGALGEQDSGTARKSRYFPIASREQIGNNEPVELLVMLVLDPSFLIALAALVSSLSAFVWAVRRKP
jgi:hypothetical protein